MYVMHFKLKKGYYRAIQKNMQVINLEALLISNGY